MRKFSMLLIAAVLGCGDNVDIPLSSTILLPDADTSPMLLGEPCTRNLPADITVPRWAWCMRRAGRSPGLSSMVRIGIDERCGELKGTVFHDLRGACVCVPQ
jgi:hypothetical protein